MLMPIAHLPSRFKRSVLTGAAAIGCSIVLALIQATNIQLIRQTNPLSASTPHSWASTFALTLPSWLLIGLALPGVMAAARRFSFQKSDRLRSAVVHIVLSLAFAMTQLLAMSITFRWFSPHTHRPTVWWSFMLAVNNLAFLEILSYWAIVGIYLVLLGSQLKIELAEAKLQSLRAQLNPHFLFNSLNAASALAMKRDHNAVVRTLAALGDLLHASLDGSSLEIPLAQELTFIETFVELQQIRFPDQVTLTTHCEPEALSAFVPSMLLQPLVENSIIHGLSSDRRTLTMAITAHRDGSRLIISVSDDGPGFGDDAITEGIGLANTRARLQQLYGPRHSFDYGNADEGGAFVALTLPWRSDQRLRLAV
jgi:hypothetical protein